MPLAAYRPCRHRGCPALSRTGYCPDHETDRLAYYHTAYAAIDQSRPTSRQRGYDTRWTAYSKARLARHPLCEEHRRNGQLVRATCTDHIVPHRGDMRIFWDKTNHQSLCLSCNSKKSAKEAHDRKKSARG